MLYWHCCELCTKEYIDKRDDDDQHKSCNRHPRRIVRIDVAVWRVSIINDTFNIHPLALHWITGRPAGLTLHSTELHLWLHGVLNQAVESRQLAKENTFNTSFSSNGDRPPIQVTQLMRGVIWWHCLFFIIECVLWTSLFVDDACVDLKSSDNHVEYIKVLDWTLM